MLGVRPDTAAIAKPLHQPPIAHGEQAEAVWADPCGDQEVVNVGEEAFHGRTKCTLLRSCQRTHIRARKKDWPCYVFDMSTEGWRGRLFAAIEKDGRSDRAISTAAALGPNYVGQMRRRGTSPSLEQADQLCRALGVSQVYILTGLELDAEGEKFVRLSTNLSSHQRQQLVRFLEALDPSASES